MSELGTTDKSAEPSGASGGVTSGTASDAMIKAAASASSAETPAVPTGERGAGASGEPGGGRVPVTPSGTTGQPGSTEGKPGTPGGEGFIPTDRHQAAVRNAREEALKPYAWAKELSDAGMKPEEVKAAVSLLTRLRSDPDAFWKQLGSELGGGTTTEPEETMPEADLVSQDGKVKAFSDAALIKALGVQEKRLLKQFRTEMKPLMEFHSSEMTARQRQDFDARTQRTAQSALKRAESLPHFTENKVAIAETMAALHESSPELLDEVGPAALLLMAYNQVLQEKVFPTIGKTSETKVLDDLKRKAATTGSIHPGGGGGHVEKPALNNVTDLAAHMEKLAAQATT